MMKLMTPDVRRLISADDEGRNPPPRSASPSGQTSNAAFTLPVQAEDEGAFLKSVMAQDNTPTV